MKEIKSDLRGILFILPCHCVYDTALNCIYAEHPEDLAMFLSDLGTACRLVREQWGNDEQKKEQLLVISGGKTKIERDCSESRSYAEWAGKKNIELPEKTYLEEYALTSIENLLFSLYIYADKIGHFPEIIQVLSWGFKEKRFKQTLEAIKDWEILKEWSKEVWGWQNNNFYQWNLDYQPIGNPRGNVINKIQPIEDEEIELLKRGIEEYYKDKKVKEKLTRRDPFKSRSLATKRYEEQQYPLPYREYKFHKFTVSDL